MGSKLDKLTFARALVLSLNRGSLAFRCSLASRGSFGKVLFGLPPVAWPNMSVVKASVLFEVMDQDVRNAGEPVIPTLIAPQYVH